MSLPSTGSLPLRFTAAHWVAAAYSIPCDRLVAHLPEGLAPVKRKGTGWVRLVARELVNVEVAGVSVPGLGRVPALELQAYVRSDGEGRERSGTWTVQAYVPQRRVAWAARWMYGAEVSVAAMQPVWREREGAVEATYRLDWKGREQRVRVRAETGSAGETSSVATLPLDGSVRRYGKGPTGGLTETSVSRQRERVYPANECHVTMAWASVFGEIGALLQDRDPMTVVVSPALSTAVGWPRRAAAGV